VEGSATTGATPSNQIKIRSFTRPIIERTSLMKFIQTLILTLALATSGLAAAEESAAHKTTAVVKSVDKANGKVKLAHEPVKSLNWPAMTMNFSVKDPSLFDKLTPGKKVEIEFVQQGSTSVVTDVQ
jgi:Cu/Ag efflux protein CusF